jgi:hypothetical protein
MDTGTIGPPNVVVPVEGGFPNVLKNQVLCGLPFGSTPGVEYEPLKFGTESIPEMPGSVVGAAPFFMPEGLTCVNFRCLPATAAAVI